MLNILTIANNNSNHQTTWNSTSMTLLHLLLRIITTIIPINPLKITAMPLITPNTIYVIFRLLNLMDYR